MTLAGRAGEECAKADGRELWLLGEMYEVAGLRNWLLKEGIQMGTLFAACEFGLVPEGVEREGILERCVGILEERYWVVDDSVLRKAGRESVKELVVGASKQGAGTRLGWRYVRDAFFVLECWIKANGGACGGGDLAGFRAIVGELDLLSMPMRALQETMKMWEYFDAGWVENLYERKRVAGDNAHEIECRVDWGYTLRDVSEAGRVALDGKGPDKRMAVIDLVNSRVSIGSVESGRIIATVGSWGRGPGQFRSPNGVAFSSTGELYVSDGELHRIQVFDTQGRYIRGFGSQGDDEDEFQGPAGLSFTADGNLVVADYGNKRVVILRDDGTYVSSFRMHPEDFFGEPGSGPLDVCVGPDGSIAVICEDACFVQVLNQFLLLFLETASKYVPHDRDCMGALSH